MKPISTAVLSYGMSGRVFHCPLLSTHAGFSLDAVVMRKPQALDRYPGTKVYATIDAVLQLPAIELIVVNLPNEFHFAIASAALKAGKHVVLEKPFTVTSAEAKELITLAKSTGKLLTV